MQTFGAIVSQLQSVPFQNDRLPLSSNGLFPESDELAERTK